MAVIKVDLKRNFDPNGRGFEIQGLQQSKVFHGECIKDIVIQSVNPDRERGGHYHECKTEWFMALNGEAELVWSEKINSEKADLRTIVIKADYDNPYILEVQPKTCHWITNNTKEVFIMASFSSREFDPNNRDMEKCYKK